MLPACRTAGEAFAVPTFDLVRSDVEGFMEKLWEFQAAFHDCFTRSEPRAHFFDYMVGQLSPLERKSIEPMALQGEGGTIRGLQRFISDVRWDEEQMQWNYHQLVADAMGEPDGVLMFDETGGLDHGVGHPSCLVILTLVVGFSGCTGISQTEQSALSGGAIGAVGGAWLGAMVGNAGMGVAIGGEGGLTGGYLYGKHKEAEQKASQ